MADIYEEHRIVLTWTVGDSLAIDQGDLKDWEAVMVLQKALEMIETDQDVDQDHEADST